jgi:hypothetical protein
LESMRNRKKPKPEEDMNETAYRVVQESIRERPEPKPPAKQEKAPEQP